MRKQTVLLAAVSILLLTSCKNGSDEVTPNYSSVSAESDSTGGKKTCNGGPKSQNPPPPPEKVMADLDLDKDQLISKREAKGPLVNDFDRIDSNKDGFVSLEELKAGGPPPPKQ